MIGRILSAGIVAGLIAGAVGFGTQMLKVIPLIEKAETYETAARARALLRDKPAGAKVVALPAKPDPLIRAGLTLIASLLTGVGFGLVLAGAIAFSGRRPGAAEGLLWGAGGYTAFVLAPALVLPPHLPGMAEADLVLRQIWWLAVAGTTALGLALAAFGARGKVRLLGIGLLALPFVLAGPAPGQGQGAPLPAELVAGFVAASLAASAAFWAVLGIGVSMLIRRLEGKARAP
ncbi:MAG: CbtA family protein [Alphaproteobacteria bacterium]|nr:CbtA family protein [Alphaproteobacteria bacterium]